MNSGRAERKNIFICFLLQIYFLPRINISYFSPFATFLFFSLSFLNGRYYRANSVRFPTQVCEGVCSLNHYCSITRIDYREYRQCLEAGTNAIASGTGSIRRDMNNKFLLLLIAFIQLLLHQHVRATQIVLGAARVKSSIVRAFKSSGVTQLQLAPGC
jgi:hypothetical protein